MHVDAYAVDLLPTSLYQLNHLNLSQSQSNHLMKHVIVVEQRVQITARASGAVTVAAACAGIRVGVSVMTARTNWSTYLAALIQICPEAYIHRSQAIQV